MKFRQIKQLPVANQLGEGILWDQPTESFWWVDILGSKLHRYILHNDHLQTWSTPTKLCCFALTNRATSDEPQLLAAFEDGLALYEPMKARVDWIVDIEKDNPGSRLNDGRTDPKGRFWVGGVVDNPDVSTAGTCLYQVNSDLTVEPRIQNLSISNGVCWSPDGAYLYHTDTPSQTIHRYTALCDGSLAEKTEFAKTEKGCMPDGSITDAAGNVYNAEWGGSKVRAYSPHGDVIVDIPLPVSQITCVAFGGRELSILAVTTAAVGVEDAGAGDLYLFESDCHGVIQPRFSLIAETS